jgi:hypothetical protein
MMDEEKVSPDAFGEIKEAFAPIKRDDRRLNGAGPVAYVQPNPVSGQSPSRGRNGFNDRKDIGDGWHELNLPLAIPITSTVAAESSYQSFKNQMAKGDFDEGEGSRQFGDDGDHQTPAWRFSKAKRWPIPDSILNVIDGLAIFAEVIICFFL